MRHNIHDNPAGRSQDAIGELRLWHRGHTVAATLDGELHWRSASPEIVPMLTSASGVDAIAKAWDGLDAPSRRRLGRHALYRAASRVGGQVTLAGARSERDLQIVGR